MSDRDREKAGRGAFASHTGVTVLEWSNDASGYTVPRILTWSDLSHIYADDELPLKYNGSIPL